MPHIRHPARPPQVARLLALAAQSLQAGQHTGAADSLRLAAQLLPGDAGILHDFGLALLECGHAEDAIAALNASIAADPNFADTHLRLGIALEMAGSVEAALAAYRRASALLPSLADARYREGELLDSLGRAEEAGEAYRRAASGAAKTPLGRIAAAKAKLAADRHAEAEKILLQALALDKTNAIAHELLGNVLAESGRFEAAWDAFAHAIENSQLRAGCYYDLVRCRRIVPEDGVLLARMEAATMLPGLEPAQRARVHLALGKAADDLGDYARAMRHFDASEALRNEILRFDLPAFEAFVERMMAAFPPGRFAQGRADVAVGMPIVILGLPRSGTTLVEQIFAAHPGVAAGGELPFWNERGAIWEKVFSGTDLPGAAQDAFFEGAANDYRAALRRIAPHATRVTDKMPLNFQWAGLIHAAVPDAIIIHCRRSPIDTALSIHQTHFNPRMPFPTGGAALVGYIGAYQRLAAHWRRVLPPERFIDVEYETLTAMPDTTIRALLAACGLDWSEACLRPDLHSRVVRTPSKWQVRQPITGSAVGRWRAYAEFLGPLSALVP